MLTEKRTQIYLTHAQHGSLARMSARRGVSLAQLVREAIDQYLMAPRLQDAGPGPDPLGDLIGSVRGPGDLADRHDEYLYGPQRKR
jgi:hypothetical protein